MLDKIIKTKQKEVADLYAVRPSFCEALNQSGLGLIAELKKASPSKGVIRPDFDPVALAQQFDAAAVALSVLTDETYFHGHLSYIQQANSVSNLPKLRKDFIIDSIQIDQAKLAGASAVLLIKACLDVEPLQQLITYANAQGLDCLVEVHNRKELDGIKDITGKIAIGVNNRDLYTFHTDTATAEQLLPVIRGYFPVAPAVAESGYLNVADLDRLSEIGFNAVLIGEGLAKNPDLLNWFIS